MQNYGLIKLGLAALLSMSMVACQSTDEATDTTTATTPAANTNGAGGPSAAERAELERKAAALAKTKFYFDFDKSDLSQEDRDALVYHAADLKSNPSKHIRLEGHADEQGTREYNLALGERRAQSVERYLQAQGVAASQMETVSYGEERPEDAGTTESAYSKNRRVEMVK